MRRALAGPLRSGLTGGEAGDEALARAAEPVAREGRHEDALVRAERAEHRPFSPKKVACSFQQQLDGVVRVRVEAVLAAAVVEDART